MCCRQPLCTRCFISIRKPPSGRIISCPFCNKRDLGVSYVPPLTFIEAKACGQVDTAIANKTVRCESIRAYVYLPASSYPNQRRTNYYHYPANSQVRNHTVMGQGGGGGLSGNGGRVPINRFVPYTGPAFTVRYGDRTTRYGRGTLVMYNERGVPIYLPPGSGEVYTARHAATRLATDVFNN